jgi:hypothetical protein
VDGVGQPRGGPDREGRAGGLDAGAPLSRSGRQAT